MQTLYRVQQGQTLADVCVQVYGSVDNLMKLAMDNNLGLNVPSDAILGEYLVYDDGMTFNPIVFNSNKNKGIIYATRDNVIYGSQGSFNGSFDDSFEGGG